MSELADTSAWIWSRRLAYPQLRAEFDAALIDGSLATCDMVRLELLHSARNPAEFADLRDDLAVLRDCPIGKPQWERALWVYGQLSTRRGGSEQRSVKHADLLVAAAAEAAGITVLHYDEDYDRIAGITGQPTRWLAPRGTLR
ncbi:MAG: PIN domain-containing protein [Sporichthyaceae bacterium]